MTNHIFDKIIPFGHTENFYYCPTAYKLPKLSYDEEVVYNIEYDYFDFETGSIETADILVYGGSAVYARNRAELFLMDYYKCFVIRSIENVGTIKKSK